MRDLVLRQSVEVMEQAHLAAQGVQVPEDERHERSLVWVNVAPGFLGWRARSTLNAAASEPIDAAVGGDAVEPEQRRAIMSRRFVGAQEHVVHRVLRVGRVAQQASAPLKHEVPIPLVQSSQRRVVHVIERWRAAR